MVSGVLTSGSGTLNSGGKSVPVKGTLNGDQLTLTAGDTKYAAHVAGDSMHMTKAGSGNFTATKTGS